MATDPIYFYRSNVLLAMSSMTAEALTDYRFLVNFDRFEESAIRVVFTFDGGTGAPSGYVKFRVGGDLDALDGDVIHGPDGVAGGFSVPQTIVFTVPKTWTGVQPFKLTGASDNSQAFAMGAATMTIAGAIPA